LTTFGHCDNADCIPLFCEGATCTSLRSFACGRPGCAGNREVPPGAK
jgi:hypothetical protein